MEKEHLLVSYNEFLAIGMLFGQKNLIDEMVLEAMAAYENKARETVTVFAPRFTNWISVASKDIREPDSLILDDGVYEEIIFDIDRYSKSREWYLELGIPWRRGYLLCGEPGNGKTSLVLTIAGRISADIYTINLATPGMTDEKFEFLFSDVPPGNIILLEEIDVAFKGRSATDSAHHLKVTFSGLLNALDGVSTKDGRIVFITTNCVEKLDAALIRPGRVDKVINISNASRSQIERMYLKFYKNATIEDAQSFAAALPDRQYSVAAIQEIFIKSRENDFTIDQNFPYSSSKDLPELPRDVGSIAW